MFFCFFFRRICFCFATTTAAAPTTITTITAPACFGAGQGCDHVPVDRKPFNCSKVGFCLATTPVNSTQGARTLAGWRNIFVLFFAFIFSPFRVLFLVPLHRHFLSFLSRSFLVFSSFRIFPSSLLALDYQLLCQLLLALTAVSAAVATLRGLGCTAGMGTRGWVASSRFFRRWNRLQLGKAGEGVCTRCHARPREAGGRVCSVAGIGVFFGGDKAAWSLIEFEVHR